MASKLLVSIMRFLGWRWGWGWGWGLLLFDGLEVAGGQLGHRLLVGCGLGVLGFGGALVLGLLLLDLLVGGLAVGGAHATEVDAELLGGPEQVVVLLAQLRALALL